MLLGENSAAAAEHPTLEALGRTATLCNDAALRARGGAWMVEGDPMEGALLSLATKLGADRTQLGGVWTRSAALPFDSRHRYMATLDRSEGGEALVSVKGAPERILTMCSRQLGDRGEDAPLDADYWHNTQARAQSPGE